MSDDLELVVAFLNTVDVEADIDELGEPPVFATWLDARGLLPAGTRVDERAVQAARALRSALRDLAGGHHDGHPEPGAAARFSVVGQTLPLHAVAEAAGSVRLQPAGDGVDAALARIVAAVAHASAIDEWQRVKVCPADDCQWAFIDRSKNQSRRWCAMGVCGNRQKTRSYRERQREQPGST